MRYVHANRWMYGYRYTTHALIAHNPLQKVCASSDMFKCWLLKFFAVSSNVVHAQAEAISKESFHTYHIGICELISESHLRRARVLCAYSLFMILLMMCILDIFHFSCDDFFIFFF